MKLAQKLLVILAVAAASTAIAATPAQASVDHCAVPQVCIWFDSSFDTSPDYYWTSPSNGCINFGSAINDKARSVRNLAGWVATFYTDAGCSGQQVVTVSRYGSVGTYRNCSNSLGDGNGFWNNLASGCSSWPNNRRISSVWISN